MPKAPATSVPGLASVCTRTSADAAAHAAVSGDSIACADIVVGAFRA